MKSFNAKTTFSFLVLWFFAAPLQAQFPATMEFIFLIDVSGSMEWSLDGTNVSVFGGPQIGPGNPGSPGNPPYPPAAGSSWQRLWYVRQCLPVLGDIVENIPPVPTSTKRFAVGIFPGATFPASATPVLLQGTGGAFISANLRAWNQCEFNNILGSGPLVATAACPGSPPNQITSRWNGTPIGDALQLADTQWPGALPANTGRILFLLTDGSDHGSVMNPYTVAANLKGTKSVKIAALGIGQSGVSETDYTLLTTITTDTDCKGGPITSLESFNSDALLPKNLTNTLVTTFFNALCYSTVSDPVFTMRRGTVKTFNVEVTNYDEQLYFITSWHEPVDSNKVVFTLQTPNLTITPQNAASLGGVTFIDRSAYMMYVINPNFLQANLGTWRLIIDGANLPPETEQLTDYFVGGPSALKIDIDRLSSHGIIFTGDSLRYVFRAIAGETILKNVNMKVEIAKPSMAPGNWYAAHKLSAAELKYVKSIKFPGEASDTYKKSYYLRQFKKIAPPSLQTDRLKLFDDGEHTDNGKNDGTFGNALKNISRPGLYRSRLLVDGKTPTGQAFTREHLQNLLVEPKIDSTWGASRLDIGFLSQNDSTKTFEIKFTPRDRFGNFFIPGQAQHVKIEVSGKRELIGELDDDLQGSYTQIVIVPRAGPRPIVTVSYKETRFPLRPLVDETMVYTLAVKPYIGNLYFAKKIPIRDALTYGVQLATHLTSRLGLEARIGLTPTEDSLGTHGVIMQADGDLAFDLASRGAVVPYLSVGGGWVSFKKFSSTHSGGSINVGGGIKLRSSNHLAFTVAAKDYILFNAFGTGTSHNLFVTAGVSVVLAK